MLNMKVKDYRITSDNSQIIVNKLRRDENGNIRKNKADEESLALVGYYGTLEHALNGIVRDYTLSDEVTIKTIQEYRNACFEVIKDFRNELELGVKVDD